MGDDGCCFVMFQSKRGLTLDAAAELLRQKGLTVESIPDGFNVSWGGPTLHVARATGSHVAEESAEIAALFAKGDDRAALAACDARFEITFDLDEALDEANTLIEVQLDLQAATGGFVFRQWNESLAGPDAAA